MRSGFYSQGVHRGVAQQVTEYLNTVPDFLSAPTSRSTRAVGDAIETVVAERFDAFLGDWCQEYSSDFARRAMPDIAFTDTEGVYSAVDVKTHRIGTAFNRPNLTSVERLASFYKSDLNVFSILMVTYSVHGTKVAVSDVLFAPIEFLDWRCLRIGALGWGQIQIANSNDIRTIEGFSRKDWMLELCDVLADFYPKEIGKTQERMHRFEDLRKHWFGRDDIWA